MAGRRLRFQVDDPEGVVAILVMGAGIVAWAAGLDRWWLVFALGWFVLVPLVGEVTTRASTAESADLDAGASDEDAALATLRERYASGDLSEAEFERRVERLLETERVEDARERVASRDRDPERAR